MSDVQRFPLTVHESEGDGRRNGKRIREKMDEVVRIMSETGASLNRVARIPGAPGLRTLKRWSAENLYGFRKRCQRAQRDPEMQAYCDDIKRMDREIAYLEGRGEAFDREQFEIFIRAFTDAEREGDPRYSIQQNAVLDLVRQGWSWKRIVRYSESVTEALKHRQKRTGQRRRTA